MKNKVVIFSKYGARILINPPDFEELKLNKNCIVNPDLSQVKGLPPHMWEKKGDACVPRDPNSIIEQPFRSSVNKLHLNKWVILSILLGTIINTAISLYKLL